MGPLQLKVPHYHQERGVPLCSLWCLKMVYEYHGLHREVPDLLAAVRRIPTGVYIQEVARHALAEGFAAALTTGDSVRLPLIYRRMSPLEIAADLRARLAGDGVGEKEAAYLDGLLRFLEAGGELRPRVPTLGDPIAADLAEGYPVICSLDMKALYGERGLDAGWPPAHQIGQVGHYVVVVGLDETTVTLNDPSTFLGGIVRYPHHRFLYALYSYQGYLLSIRRR